DGTPGAGDVSRNRASASRVSSDLVFPRSRDRAWSCASIASGTFSEIVLIPCEYHNGSSVIHCGGVCLANVARQLYLVERSARAVRNSSPRIDRFMFWKKTGSTRRPSPGRQRSEWTSPYPGRRL